MRYTELVGTKQLATKEKPDPVPDGIRPIIKVECCGICGSDLHHWEYGDPIGLNQGHEFAGTIVDPGERKDLKVGDRVTCISTAPCLECDMCKAGLHYKCTNKAGAPGILHPDNLGAYAEYFVPLKSGYVYKLPDNISFEHAAMTEPAAITKRATDIADIQKGDKVVVAGGGLIGAMCIQWARLKGASWVGLTETNKNRAEKVMSFGYCDAWFDAREEGLREKVREAAGAPSGVDLFFECTAHIDAINFGFSVIRTEGRIVWVGVTLEPRAINHWAAIISQCTLRTSIGYANPTFEECFHMIADGKFPVGHYHTSSVTFDGMQKAFETLFSPDNDQFKIILYPQK